MTVEQALNMIAPARLLIADKTVIFNTWDEEESRYWSAQGATVRPFYTLQELERMRSHGYKTQQGWEVSLAGACDPIVVRTLDGKVEDRTRTALAAQARRRREEAGV